MAGLGLLSLLYRWRGTLYRSRFLHAAAVAMSPAGFIAVLSGWITAEVGRQPYTVYGALRTSDSISPVDAAAVGASLIAFLFIYTAVFGAGTFYILRLMLKRPELHEPELPSDEPLRAAGIMPGPAREIAAEHIGARHVD
jgi:cytochrome bd ubiquinol oxidase subunit I